MKKTNTNNIWGVLRLTMGWTFLWAFLDKLFGLGMTTAREASWLMGGSPTSGFLQFATKGPFSELFQMLSGSVLVDWLFMLGLLLMGLALGFGIGVRLASLFGSILMFLMWLAVLPPEHNPFLDEHIIYIIVLIGVAMTNAGQYLGFGKHWSKLKLVKKNPWLI